ncbi:MAG: hypothetical protein IJF92_00775 [Bacilli bacterium]|nr:hypothetical protein [Bacilli bacterium]MBQ3307652.1 hypothetical protein [Bacilli bacterium]
MGLLFYDIEFQRHIDVEKEVELNLEQIKYYIRTRGKTGIRFRYYEEMEQFKNILHNKLDNVMMFNSGSILYIRR